MLIMVLAHILFVTCFTCSCVPFADRRRHSSAHCSWMLVYF